MNSGENYSAVAFPHSFFAVFSDVEDYLRRLYRAVSLLAVAYELKQKQFSVLVERLSSLLGFEVTRDSGLYIDLKRGRYYVVRIRSNDRLLSKYMGKNPGELVSLISKFRELKGELSRLEFLFKEVEDALESFISKADRLIGDIEGEVEEVEENVDTQ